jgi:hypothetical protein
MKAYTYTASELGLPSLPDGQLRLAGFEPTRNPQEADAFIVPTLMQYIGKDKLLNLPYLRGNERRHVMFNIGEWMGVYLGIPAIMFRCDMTKKLKSHDPTALAWPWPVENLGEWMGEHLRRDVVFQGWVSTPLTDVVCDSVLTNSALSTHIQRHKGFFGYEPDGAERTKLLRRTFLETLASSRLSLVARSIPEGVVRYRLYESLSMGRVPVHLCDGCVMPFADRIDWDSCVLTIAEKDAPQAGEIIEDWLCRHSDADIRERGLYGRRMWETWLDSSKWDDLFALVVREKLEL